MDVLIVYLGHVMELKLLSRKKKSSNLKEIKVLAYNGLMTHILLKDACMSIL